MNIILFEKGTVHFDSDDERAIHLEKVLHATVSSSFVAGEINGRRGSAVITSMEDGIDFEFLPECDDSSLHPLTVILGQARPICMRRILRELVSLGVERMILTISDLGEKSYRSAGLYTSGEYRNILLDGAMQSGRTGVSEVVFASCIEEAISNLDADPVRLLLDNVVGSKRFGSMDLKGRSVVLAIGPERGWSQRERGVFAKAGFSPVLMGKRILRTETAAVAGTALALECMDLI
ncbi:MAG: RNA methyltransferase [Spirochaetales bacterium]|nr:RNA methyltransferase [Spirochaetales bacterium]